ncbi:MAG: FAD-dependent oxidoreductase [Pseudomonadota bacterium]
MAQRVVIVGAGHAAGELCGALVQSSVTAANGPGHDLSITLIGDEPDLPYQRPPLSKAYLTGKLPRERLFLRDTAFYRDAEVTCHLAARMTQIDRDARMVMTEKGDRVPYDTLVLATGAAVRRLPVPGAEMSGVHYVRTIADTEALSVEMKTARRLVVIGGGYIGLEVAASARRKGLEVTVLEAMPRILARVASEELSAAVTGLHEREGVEIATQATVSEIVGDTSVSSVRLSDGSEILCDLIVVGIGVIPNDEQAAAAGLDVDNGIQVDAHCRTSDPNIFAAGDVARFKLEGHGSVRIESVQNAAEQAKHIAAHIQGQVPQAAYAPTPWFWSDQYDTKIQIAGLSGSQDAVFHRPGGQTQVGSYWLYRENKLIAVEAFGDARAYMMGKRWLENNITPDPARVANPDIAIKQVV